METRLDQSTIDSVVGEAGAATAIHLLRWARATFGSRLCVLASMQDAVLIDLAMRVDRSIPIVFLDTGYHFESTLDTVRSVESRYGITIETHGPLTAPNAAVKAGECCSSKVNLLEQALKGRDAWVSGVGRSQTSVRASTRLIDKDRRGIWKISPLAQWNEQDRENYIVANDVLVHPLLSEGYTSIGCEPCTSRPTSDDLRSGRWAGTGQVECGLHL